MMNAFQKIRGLVLPRRFEQPSLKIYSCSLPEKLIFPLFCPYGNEFEPTVQPGDIVQPGDCLAIQRQQGTQILASAQGIITDIKSHAYHHPSQLPAKSIILSVSTQQPQQTRPHFSTSVHTREQLLRRVQVAGILGLGGAGFPTATKLKANPCHTLIINAVECEPPISCDNVLIANHAEDIVAASQQIADLLSIQRVIIAVEENNTLSLQKLKAAQHAFTKVSIKAVPVQYPSGDIKQLIFQLTGVALKKTQHAISEGLLCQNVATLFAIHQAINLGQGLTDRLVTIEGKGFERPGNYRVALGTPIQHLLDIAGFNTLVNYQVMMGGDMMGMKVHDFSAPITPRCQAIMMQEVVTAAARPCIRCGDCFDVCPVHILPQQLYWYASQDNHAACEKLHARDCIECGCCDKVCPSNIPIVSYIRMAKATIATLHQEQAAQDIAELQYQAKQSRLAKQAITETTQRQRHQTRKKLDKKALIRAAVARANKKKRQHHEPVTTTEKT